MLEEYELVVLATGKRDTFVEAQILWQLSNLDLMNPEHGVEKLGIEPELEPLVKDPEAAVLFKIIRIVDRLNRLSELYPEEYTLKPTAIFAADVMVSINGEEPLSREDRGEVAARNQPYVPTPEKLQELKEIYHEKEFEAEWIISFGAAFIDEKEEKLGVGTIVIKASYPGLSEQEIIDNYNPFTSANLNLIELLPTASELWVILENDQEKIFISHDLAIQLIVSKVPTFEMIKQLYEADLSSNPHYGVLASSLIRETAKI